MQIWVERGTDFDACEWTHMYKAPLLWRPCGTSVRARYTHQWQEKSPQLWCHCIATLLPIAGVDLCGYSFGDWELTQFHWKLLVIFLTSCSWHHWRPRPMILFKAMNCHSCNCWPSGFAQVILYIEQQKSISLSEVAVMQATNLAFTAGSTTYERYHFGSAKIPLPALILHTDPEVPPNPE